MLLIELSSILKKTSRQVHFGCRYIGLTFNKEFYKDFIRSDEYFITKAVDILQGSSLTYDYTITRVFEYTDENGNTRIFGLLPKYENNKRREYLVEFFLQNMKEKEYPKSVDVIGELGFEDARKVLERLLELNKV